MCGMASCSEVRVARKLDLLRVRHEARADARARPLQSYRPAAGRCDRRVPAAGRRVTRGPTRRDLPRSPPRSSARRGPRGCGSGGRPPGAGGGGPRPSAMRGEHLLVLTRRPRTRADVAHRFRWRRPRSTPGGDHRHAPVLTSSPRCPGRLPEPRGQRRPRGSFEFRAVPHAVFSAKGDGVSRDPTPPGSSSSRDRTRGFLARWTALDGEPVLSKSKKKSSSGGAAADAPLDLEPPVTGSDEAGKGDYFGPLVVAAVRADADGIARLEALGVRDSRDISPTRARCGWARRSRRSSSTPSGASIPTVQPRLPDLPLRSRSVDWRSSTARCSASWRERARTCSSISSSDAVCCGRPWPSSACA